MAQPVWRLYQVGPADWGAPTLDPACLKVQAFMRFIQPSESWFETNDDGATHISPERTLPVLQNIASGEITTDSDRIIAQLSASQGGAGAKPMFGALASVSEQERCDVAAYSALVEDKLYIAMLYEWWWDDSNYSAMMKPAMTQALPFPTCFYLPYVVRRRNLARVTHFRVDTPERAREVGSTCFAALARRLGRREYFFGDKPSSLDATVYAFLELIRRAPVQHGVLLPELAQHPPLIEFCDRISARYFADVPVPKVGEIPIMVTAAAQAGPGDDSSSDEAASKAMSPEEQVQMQEAQWWLGGTAAVMLLYMSTPGWIDSS